MVACGIGLAVIEVSKRVESVSDKVVARGFNLARRAGNNELGGITVSSVTMV